MRQWLDTSSIEDYRKFLRIKSLPQYRISGGYAEFPDEYATIVSGCRARRTRSVRYTEVAGLFDYQRDIIRMALKKRKFCVFADCGLGKTLIFLEFARHVENELPAGKAVLIVSPLMVIPQTLDEAERFYGGMCGQQMHIRQVQASELPEWTQSPDSRIGITNYEALTGNVRKGKIGALILDESSMLKSHYGKWGQKCLELGAGLEWKMACTGTPAPNDRIEYANHAVFMDAYPNVNAFLAKFFVNRGQTDNRWELKPHATDPFYRSLSHWSIFLTNPATYGWKDNCAAIPPIHVHVHRVPLTDDQQGLAFDASGRLFNDQPGGIGSRSVLSQIAKGSFRGREVSTHKPEYIRELVDSWPTESTLIWCIYNDEQSTMEVAFPDAASITGSTAIEDRLHMVRGFKSGEIRVLISKPKILGFGLNLQMATRQVFSGLQDSYESYYQAVKRSNRYGSTRPLNVHIPVTDIERPMIETVLEKARRVQQDTEEQERIFKHAAVGF